MPERRRSKRWIWWLIFGVLIVGVVLISYFVWDGYFRDKSGAVEQDGVTSVPITEENLPENSEEILKDLAERVVEEKRVEQFEPSDEADESELSGVVTYVEVVNDELQIGVNINQYLSSGTCEFILRQDGKVMHQGVVDVEPMVSTSTCSDFNVPVSNLNSGNVDIEVYLNSEGKHGIIRGEGVV